MNKKQFAALLVSMALLASCNNQGNPASSNGNSAGDISSSILPPDSSNGDTPISSKPVTTYSIVDRTGEGVTITLSKTEAPKGETINITALVAEGFVLTGIYANDVACTKVNDTTYTFVMPDQSVVLTSKLTVTGEAVVTGDVAARLDKQSDGTFKGTVTASVSSKIAVKVGNTTFGYGAIDLDASFGDIGDASNDSFRISGNGVYEINFDASKGTKPITIIRKGFVHAPQSEDDLANAFCGDYAGRNVNDGGTYNAPNIKKATYRSSRSAVSYEWNLYANNISIATATNLLTDEQSTVYKKLTATNYRVVDTYIETGKDRSGIYWDDTKKNDGVAYSADYEVVANPTDGYYQMAADYAKRDLATPSHEMHSVDRDMHYGYRTGFTVEDEVKAVGRVFTGTANADGSYTTTVKSWKNFQDSNSRRSRSSYEISVTFNADSTVKSGSYKEYSFDDTNWNYNDNDADNGGSAIAGKSGTTVQISSYSYEYGAVTANAPAFDETPYFISSITSADVTSKDLEANHIQQNDIVEDWRTPQRESIESDSYGYSSLLHMSFEPATALNRWQYGVVASSDMRVVGTPVNGTYGFQALRTGTSTLTINGHVPGSASKSVDVTVVNGVLPKNYFFMAATGYDDDFVDATHVQVRAGSTTAVRLVISPVNANYNPTITTNNPNLVVTLDNDYDTSRDAYYTAKILHIDATAMTNTSNETVKLYVSDNWDPTYRTEANFKVDLDVVVMPKPAAGLWPSSLAGTTWTSNRDLTVEKDYFGDATIEFTDETVDINNKTYSKAILNVTSGHRFITNYVMGYEYNANTPSLKFHGTLNEGWNDANTPCEVYAESGTFGFALAYGVWTGSDGVSYTNIIGDYVSPADEDEYGITTAYVTFTRNA